MKHLPNLIGLILALVLGTAFSCAQGGSSSRTMAKPAPSAVQLYPFRSPANGQVGFIDGQGNIKITPHFSDCGGVNAGPEFFDGHLLVGCAPVGYAEPSGAQLTAAQFDDARPFSHGMAAIKTKDGVWGYINSSGKTVILPKFADAGSFSEGLAPVSNNDGDWGYVDSAGRVKIPFQFQQAGEFSGGLAPVQVNGQFGYIDKSAKLVVSPQFKDAKPFSEGLAPVFTGSWHYIGPDGKTALPGDYEQAGEFSGGLAPVKAKGSNLFGYINRSGSFVIQPQFESANSFRRGLALAYFKTDKLAGPEGRRVLHYGYIDETGRTVFSSNLPYIQKKEGSRGSGDGPSYIPMATVNIESLPAGAKVYLVPLDDWESDTNLGGDKEKMLRYLLNGYTPLRNYEVIEQVYRVFIEVDGRRVARQFDVNRYSSKNLQIDFQKEQ